MSDMLKFLGSELNRVYSAVVGKPMSWRMIDALVSLEEAAERSKQGASREDDSASTPDPADPVDPPSEHGSR